VHPALSVIFFTVVSGCGYGLLFLLGVLVAVDPRAFARGEGLFVLAAASVLACAGLVSSTLHLGKPLRAWRAFSQWRSSWLSREGVAALATFVPALGLAAAWLGHAHGAWTRACALLLGVLAGVTVFCTARIYTSLKTIPAWHNRYVLPGYVLFALLGGAAWFATIDAFGGGREAFLRAHIGLLVALLGAWTAVLKRAYWLHIDAAPAPATIASAIGLPDAGAVRAVEAPHTEANYLTREMGFALARKHSARLRGIALVLFALVPLATAAVALFAAPTAAAIATLVGALAISAGSFVERWLFFAEARHVVMLYYPSVSGTAASP